MYAMKNGFGHSQRTISALVQCLVPAPADHARFSFKNSSNCLLTERPEFGDLDHRVVLLIGQIDRAEG
jgi:hypothetical protein